MIRGGGGGKLKERMVYDIIIYGIYSFVTNNRGGSKSSIVITASQSFINTLVSCS